MLNVINIFTLFRTLFMNNFKDSNYNLSNGNYKHEFLSPMELK